MVSEGRKVVKTSIHFQEQGNVKPSVVRSISYNHIRLVPGKSPHHTKVLPPKPNFFWFFWFFFGGVCTCCYWGPMQKRVKFVCSSFSILLLTFFLFIFFSFFFLPPLPLHYSSTHPWIRHGTSNIPLHHSTLPGTSIHTLPSFVVTMHSHAASTCHPPPLAPHPIPSSPLAFFVPCTFTSNYSFVYSLFSFADAKTASSGLFLVFVLKEGGDRGRGTVKKGRRLWTPLRSDTHE